MAPKKKTDDQGKAKLNKQYYFVSGLPRSGSTLLCNILAQNPRFSTTSTSGIMDVIFGVRNNWDKMVEFQASPNEPAKLRVMRAMFEAYYADSDKPVVFDKCRGWLSLIEMCEAIIGQKAKILVPVRDMRDVLASFEKLWRKTSSTRQMGQESQNYFRFQTVEGRCQVWLNEQQPVGLAYNRVKDAISRGYSDRLFFVDFDDMTVNPEETFKKIYKFLGEEYFEHDFDNVKQVTWENDDVHGIKDLHKIRTKVRPMDPQWPTTLGPFAEKWGQLNFWKQ